ncbi:Hypothetical predicted protein [Scomber scombrus]|uniref:Ig-like domain-containing protein n=1 Tax=Scomber scombrus TaxID=13677 RepID=A0AAV1QD98_SCOSC
MFKERFACDLSIPEVRICEYFSNFNELERTTRLEAGQIGSSQPIVATVGDDIMLPCQLKPVQDVSILTVMWTRSDLDPRYIHVSRAGQETISAKHGSYQGRTSLSIDRLKQGDISLKLSRVKLSDGGNYTCHIPHLNKESLVELIVVPDAIPSPVISISGLDRVRGGVLLQCESKGWYPLPDVIWLDGEGNLLSAGPTETVRGPDGLYTVSSRVTVEKRHNNNFTCRVQQSNQTSEKHFIVPEDFFKVPPSSSSVIIGVSVGLVVCIVVVVAVLYFVWKRRQNMIKTKSCWDETEEIPEMQPLNESQSDGKTLTVSPAVSDQGGKRRTNM